MYMYARIVTILCFLRVYYYINVYTTKRNYFCLQKKYILNIYVVVFDVRDVQKVLKYSFLFER